MISRLHATLLTVTLAVLGWSPVLLGGPAATGALTISMAALTVAGLIVALRLVQRRAVAPSLARTSADRGRTPRRPARWVDPDRPGHARPRAPGCGRV